jgi:hypothetical protein
VFQLALDKDDAVFRENLAQLEELKSNLSKTKEIRLFGGPDTTLAVIVRF